MNTCCKCTARYRLTWNTEADVRTSVDGLEEIAERFLTGVDGDTDVALCRLVVR